MHSSKESSEDYLESILSLGEILPVVRAVDISNDLGYKKSSVSIAMKKLKDNGYITVSPQGYISLTDSGREIAETIYERHKFLTRLLMTLGVDELTATNDACRIEHVISPESFEALKNFISKNVKLVDEPDHY